MTCVQFRVYVDRPRKRYYRVNIFANCRALWTFHREWRKRIGLRPVRADFDAITDSYSYAVLRDGKRTQDIGQISFHVGRLGAGVVSHEMTHAALHASPRYQGSGRTIVTQRNEERLCWTQGHLVAQFWAQYYRREQHIKRLARRR